MSPGLRTKSLSQQLGPFTMIFQVILLTLSIPCFISKLFHFTSNFYWTSLRMGFWQVKVVAISCSEHHGRKMASSKEHHSHSSCKISVTLIWSWFRFSHKEYHLSLTAWKQSVFNFEKALNEARHIC